MNYTAVMPDVPEIEEPGSLVAIHKGLVMFCPSFGISALSSPVLAVSVSASGQTKRRSRTRKTAQRGRMLKPRRARTSRCFACSA